MVEYIKVAKGDRHLEMIEIDKYYWLSILKQKNKVGELQFTVFNVEHNPEDYDETAWWKSENFKSNKKEFDELKFEFLNWVDLQLR